MMSIFSPLNFNNQKRKFQKGQTLVIVALVFSVVMGFAAMSIDGGMAESLQKKDQSIVDASALAAAYSIYEGDSEATATTIATIVSQRNGCDTTCSLTVGYYDNTGTSTNVSANVNSVRISISDTYHGFFLAAGKINPVVPISVLAEAQVSNANGSGGGSTGYNVPCALCALGTSGTVFSVQGNNSSMISKSGGIFINGNMNVSGNNNSFGVPTGQQFTVAGTFSTAGSNTYTPTPTAGAAQVSDPLAGVQTPTITGTQYSDVTVSGNNIKKTIPPGIYRHISVQGNNNTLTLSSGTYFFSGDGGITLSGNNIVINGNNVMLYFGCGTYPAVSACSNTGQVGSTINFQGNNLGLNLTPQTSGNWTNLLLYYDRHNTAGLNYAGNNYNGTASGAIYMADGALDLQGNNFGGSIGFPIIAKSMTFAGQGLTLNGSSYVSVQPAPGNLIK